MDRNQDRPDIIALPPLILSGLFLLALALEWLTPIAILPPPGLGFVFWFGLAASILAVGIAGSGVVTFHRAGTNVNPRQPALTVVSTGPYRFTRNPMYLGMVILLPGLGLAASLDWALLLAPVLWALLHYGVVLREEAYLEAKFGEEYGALKARTRRWL